MPLTAALTGFFTGLSLILAIGAQNAFVLRQGLRGEHLIWVVLACAVSDALLIALGVSSFARIAALLPWLEPVMRWGGALFLFLYGLRSLRSAWAGGAALLPSDAAPAPLKVTLATTLALTWLNPHVWLDTVVLLGTISAGFAGNEAAFGAGAMLASFVFFFSLGYGARLLRPLLATPRAWQILEAGIGLVMWAIALKLVLA